MAAIQRERNGTFTATWRDADGKRVSIPTGEIVWEKAAKKAAELEAEARFWEDQVLGSWQRLADAGFSPRYLHNVFTCGRHLPFPRFRKLLTEAEVKFKAPAAWRDRARPKGKPSGKRWSWNGGRLTIEELMEHAAEGLSRAALRFRLDKQWDVGTALSTPPMSRAESGTIGAKVSNNRTR